MRKIVCLVSFVLFLLITSTGAQTIDSALLLHPWKAAWIDVPNTSPHGYGVYLFRKHIALVTKPGKFVIHVSADNRYLLYVNEKLVSAGPARGDINHWNFETIDIAPYLQTGDNLLAAKVWNEGEYRPEAQITSRTAFILQGNGREEQVVNTDTTWKCRQDSSYAPLRFVVPLYYVAGPGEFINMNEHIQNWMRADGKEDDWFRANPVSQGMPKGVLGGYGTISEWMLQPSVLPQRDREPERLQSVRWSKGISVPVAFPAEKTSFTVAPNQKVQILLDQGYLTNAYPTLTFSNGKNATISLRYAEALYFSFPAKGNRNEVDGKTLIGRQDSILSNGEKQQVFTPLDFRTYRYIQLDIQTQNQPLVIEDLYGTFTGYPFRLRARLHTTDTSLNQILQTGWRTARLCAWETYTDCPYYEQLQYIGDGRIQALISLYNSGDDRLVKNALNQMDESRRPEGITESRHPSFTPQYISTFSLWYIGMLHDYVMYGSDTEFIRQKLSGARAVLDYFHRYQQEDGSLHNVPYWMFTDWVNAKGWEAGVAPVGKEGSSALTDLQLLLAYEAAADMEEKLGMKDFAVLYRQRAKLLTQTIRTRYWDEKKQLFADRPERDLFSQHANALAILAGAASANEMRMIAAQLVSDSTLAPASIYFKFYLHQALVKAGLGNDYLHWLDTWRENIKMGLTTWAEMSDVGNSRSDCHAWGASPNIEFFRTILGIDSDAPGFAKVKIEPHLGSITHLGGEMPHPQGTIKTDYQKEGAGWKIRIELPAPVSGTFVWQGKQYRLHPGENKFDL